MEDLSSAKARLSKDQRVNRRSRQLVARQEAMEKIRDLLAQNKALRVALRS